ncbi:MAG: hypothetical protein J6P40_00455 [Oscillospiraceae bacterium]|nr:hypothetical protein [Oscillospiraceae bacterium]
MWNELTSQEGLQAFLESMQYFHDSCIKELHYISGAYVKENLSMYPVNDRRVLRVLIQRQYNECPMVEMEFAGLKHLKLFPADDQYTCEILDSTLIMENGDIYWADLGGLSVKEMEDYEGTVICASQLRWRPLDRHMGEAAVYKTT